jgi:cobalt/nickel transport system permease protein
MSLSLPAAIEATAGEQQPRGLYRWDARAKIAVLLVAVALNVVIARLALSLCLMGVSLGLLAWSRISLRKLAWFWLAPLWATLIVFVGFSIGFGQTPIGSLGPVTFYREGLLQGAAAAARVGCDISWIAAVFLSTRFLSLMEALRWFRFPEILIDVIKLAYRYVFLLHCEYMRMREASANRGGFQSYSQALRSVALILSQILLRAYDRSARIQQSMTARGDGGPPPDAAPANSAGSACPNRCDVTPDYGGEDEAVVTCRDLCFQYGPFRSLSKVSFTIRRGEAVVLCGPNGAGKTTLLRLIAGFLQPSRGQVTLCGRRRDRRNRREFFRQVGLLAQDPNDQLFCPQVREDVAYGPKNLGLSADEIERRVTTAMELMAVSHLAPRLIHTLSYGEMKRVGLAGLIAMQPPLLLLDEPFANLDPASTRQLVKLVNHLNRHHGYTVLMVTHDLNAAAQVARRIIVLNNGVIRADRPARDILTDQELLLTSRLEPPILTQLFKQMDGDLPGGGPIPVTIEEAIARLRRHPPRRQTEAADR